MSVSIYYTPSKNKIYLSNPSETVMHALEKAFGNMPITINFNVDQLDAHILDGMILGYGEDIRRNPYREIKDAVEKYGAITINAER